MLNAGDNTIIQTTGAAATAFSALEITFGNGVDLITGADSDTVLGFAGALTNDTSIETTAVSGLNFYEGTFDDKKLTFTVGKGDDLLFGNGVAGNNAFVSFASNAVILTESTFDIDNYVNLA